jgi:hypothetical protein
MSTAYIRLSDAETVRLFCEEVVELVEKSCKTEGVIAFVPREASQHLKPLSAQFGLHVTNSLLYFDARHGSGDRPFMKERQDDIDIILTDLQGLETADPARIAVVHKALTLSQPGQSYFAWLQVILRN